MSRGLSGIVAGLVLFAGTVRAQDEPTSAPATAPTTTQAPVATSAVPDDNSPLAIAQSALTQLDQLRVVGANDPQRALDLLAFLLPHYQREGKSYLTIALGCTGGRHRSIALVEELHRRLTTMGHRVLVRHRDAER